MNDKTATFDAWFIRVISRLAWIHSEQIPVPGSDNGLTYEQLRQLLQYVEAEGYGR